jgi:hypothetical protein
MVNLKTIKLFLTALVHLSRGYNMINPATQLRKVIVCAKLNKFFFISRFFPCFFIYICTMIPPIWFIELHRIEVKRNATSTSHISNSVDLDILHDSLSGLGLESDFISTNATKVCKRFRILSILM